MRRNAKGPKRVQATSTNPLAVCEPLGDRVVVLRDPAGTKTDGGILLPDNAAQSKQHTGTVISVGPGRMVEGQLVPVGVRPGQRVIITGWAGLTITNELPTEPEDDYVMIREEDVLARLPALGGSHAGSTTQRKIRPRGQQHHQRRQ